MKTNGLRSRQLSTDQRIDLVLRKAYELADEPYDAKRFAKGLLRIIGHSFGLQYAILRGRLPGKRRVEVIATYGLREADAENLDVEIDNKLAAYLRITGHFHYASDLSTDPLYEQKPYVERNAHDEEGKRVVLRSGVFTPLFTERWGFQGFLACFRSRQAGFTAREIRAIHEKLPPIIATMGTVGLHRTPPRWLKDRRQTEINRRISRFFRALAEDDDDEVPGADDGLPDFFPQAMPASPTQPSPLVLKRLVVRDFRCFRDLNVDFVDETHEAPLLERVNLILGDNGAGKTSLLRALALGMSSMPEASALVRDISQDLVIRRGAPYAQIEAYFGTRRKNGLDVGGRDTSAIITTLDYDASGAVAVSQITEPPEFPWKRRFICGYGANRRVFGDESLDRYEVVKAVESLFSYTARLQNPELILRRLSSGNGHRQKIIQAFEDVLTLPRGSVHLRTNGLRVARLTCSGTLADVGDGFAGTLSWLSDMVAHAMLYFREPVSPAELEGILILDEIEQHLHPRWQYQITQLIAKVFPKLQIIATTHSPLCVIGLEDIPQPKEGQLLLLDPEDGAIAIRQGLEPPYARRVDQILTSTLFKLPSARSRSVDGDIQRLSELASMMERSPEESAELARLRACLDDEIGAPDTILQELAEAAADVALDWLIEEKFARRAQESMQPEHYLTNHEALRLAIRHHLNGRKEMRSHDPYSSVAVTGL